MIIHEGVKLPSDCLKTADIVGNLKVIMIVMGRVQGLVKFIICDRVEHFLIDPAAVFSVYHLAHKPEIFLQRRGIGAEFLHKIKVQHIGTVQTDPVNVKFIYPEAYCFKQIAFHLGISKVEAGKLIMPLPCFIAEGVSHRASFAEVNAAVPAFEGGCLTMLYNIAEGKELSPGMIENAIHNDADPVFMAFLHEGTEGLVRSEAPVDQAKIFRIVTMC